MSARLELMQAIKRAAREHGLSVETNPNGMFYRARITKIVDGPWGGTARKTLGVVLPRAQDQWFITTNPYQGVFEVSMSTIGPYDTLEAAILAYKVMT
jgi:hypothetical protein